MRRHHARILSMDAHFKMHHIQGVNWLIEFLNVRILTAHHIICLFYFLFRWTKMFKYTKTRALQLGASQSSKFNKFSTKTDLFSPHIHSRNTSANCFAHVKYFPTTFKSEWKKKKKKWRSAKYFTVQKCQKSIMIQMTNVSIANVLWIVTCNV